MSRQYLNLLTPDESFPIMKLQGAPRNWKPLPEETGVFGKAVILRVNSFLKRDYLN